MNTIASTVSGIPYEQIPSSPYQYTAEGIRECEQLVGKPFPEEFTWYLLNTGWRRISTDHRSMLVSNGSYLYHLQFENVEHQTFAAHAYKKYLGQNTGQALPDNKLYYFPFGKIQGEINPSVSFILLINLNEALYGSVWAVSSPNIYKDKQVPPPIKIADSFTLFLAQISAADTVRPIAKQNNEALFSKLVADYQASPIHTATNAAGAEQLLELFFENKLPLVVDGARSIEFQHYSNSLRIENATLFASLANAFETMVNASWPSLQRREIKTGTPVMFDRDEYFKWEKHQYYLIPVESLVGNKCLLKEEFLLHHDTSWTMVRRLRSAMEDVKIKGVGTFTFDDTYKWELKKKVTPAWSERPAELHVEGEEDAITAPLITFIRQVLSNADFKPVLEAYIFNDYQREFNTIPDEEKAEQPENYPALNDAHEVWALLGKSFQLYIDSDNEFHLQIDCSWDDEHGLTIRVKDWQIQ